MVTKTITARQCKQARSLLKWNLYDLASRTNLPPKYLERFERNMTRLTMPENIEVKKTYEKNGIAFTDNLDVILIRQSEDDRMSLHLEEDKVYEVDEGADIIAKEKLAPEEDPNKLWVHTPDFTGPDRRDVKSQMHYTGNEKRKDRQDMVNKVIEKYKK